MRQDTEKLSRATKSHFKGRIIMLKSKIYNFGRLHVIHVKMLLNEKRATAIDLLFVRKGKKRRE